MENKLLQVYLALIFMIIMWSFSFVVVDIAVEFVPPLSIAFYRFIIASLMFIILDIYLRLKNKQKLNEVNEAITSPKFSKKDWILIFLASIAGVSFFFFAQYTAIELIGPSLPALFVCLLAPIIISILALIFFKEKLNTLKIIGFIIATIGGFFLVTGGDLTTLAPESPSFVGYLFALITPLLWALYSTVTKKMTLGNSNLKILKFVAYLGAIELFLFVLLNDEFMIFIQNIPNLVVLLSALYTGIGCYVIGYYIWQNSQLKLKSSKAASFLYIEPFITLLFSFLLQRSEIIAIWNIIGGIIVLIAVLIINYN
ncbi:MAG: DMT family transporter [Candidatus Thorarchaeota archaeon]